MGRGIWRLPAAEGGTAACLDIDHPPSPSLLPSDKSYNRFEPTSSYLIATIVWRRLPAIERHVWEATLVATAPHAHASVWIALSCTLVYTHAAARPLVVATKPLSARPPNSLTLHNRALAKHWCVLSREGIRLEKAWKGIHLYRSVHVRPVVGVPKNCPGKSFSLSSSSSSSSSL